MHNGIDVARDITCTFAVDKGLRGRHENCIRLSSMKWKDFRAMFSDGSSVLVSAPNEAFARERARELGRPGLKVRLVEVEMYDYEVIGAVADGEVFCFDCAVEDDLRDSPIFAGDAQELLCSECGEPLV